MADNARRRSDDSNGALSGSPWWVQAVNRYGFPMVVAAFLLYFITNTLTARMKSMDDTLVQHAQASAIAQERTSLYLRSMCISLAVSAGRDASTCSIVDVTTAGSLPLGIPPVGKDTK